AIEGEPLSSFVHLSPPNRLRRHRLRRRYDSKSISDSKSNSTAATSSRAERRRAETRERITRAALDLLLEEGAAKLRLSDVPERADVASGSLSTSFENKEAIADAVAAPALAEMIAVTRPDADRYEDPAEEIASASKRVVRIAWDERQLALALVG